MSKAPELADLFGAVLDLSADERQRVYRERRVPDHVVEEIESLLEIEVHEVFSQDLGGVGLHLVEDRDPSPDASRWGPGTVVDDYEIVRKLAHGGMGVVFEAKQISLGRRVALKVVRSSRFASDAELRRFQVEAESIARLDHSGIVAVHEVGRRDGEHFYSMAFVDGGSLAEVETPVSAERAAQLMRSVAEAVHYAHTRNIVHRDLKPGNVLLTADGEPRVSDFGLARDTSTESDLTVPGSIVGTPGFMPPEQAEGRTADVGPQADVYGLGAVLFYLLTGRPPFIGSTIVETLHLVIHEPPVDPRRIQPGTPADLACIVMKCLEKRPEQRYGSARDVAEELLRFSRREPIQARPIGRIARISRWCQRSPVVAGLSATALVLLVTGVVVSSKLAFDLSIANTELGDSLSRLERQAEDLEVARDEARDALADMESFSQFLVDDVISVARPTGVQKGRGRDTTVREALIEATRSVGERFVGRPKAEALARHDLGITLRTVGEYALAKEQLERALALRKQTLGPTAMLTLVTQNSLASAWFALNELGEAEALFEDVCTKMPADYGSWLWVLARRNLASIYRHTDRESQAEEILVDLLAHHEAGDTFRLHMSLARVYRQTGDYERAHEHFDAAAARAIEMHGEDSLPHLEALSTRAAVLHMQGEEEEAARRLRALHPRFLAKFTLRHRQSISNAVRLGNALFALGRHEEVVELLEPVFPLTREIMASEEWLHDDAYHALTGSLRSLHGYDELVPLRRARLPDMVSQHGEASTDATSCRINLAQDLGRLGEHQQALEQLEAAFPHCDTEAARSKDLDYFCRWELGKAWMGVGQPEKATPFLESALARAETMPEAFRDEDMCDILSLLMRNRAQRDEFEEAERIARRVLEKYEATRPRSLHAFEARIFLGGLLVRRGETTESKALLEWVYRQLSPYLPKLRANSPRAALTLFETLRDLHALGDDKAALELWTQRADAERERLAGESR